MPRPLLSIATVLLLPLSPPALGQEFVESSVPLLLGPNNASTILDRDGERLVLRNGSAAAPLEIFERQGDGSWIQAASIAPGPLALQLGDSLDGFGASVALDGERLAIGCADSFPGSTSTFRAGVVLLLERQATGVWQLTETFAGSTPDDEFAAFGLAVALAGDTLIVGAPGEAATGGVRTGAVYLFRETAPGAWTPAGQLGPGGPVGNVPDNLGVAVAANAEHLAASSFAQGRVATWLRVGDQWQLEASAVFPDPSNGSWFGTRVRLDGDRLAVGGIGQSSAGTAGAIEVFHHGGTPASWQSEAVVTAPTPGAITASFGDAFVFEDDRLYASELFLEPDPGGGFPLQVVVVRRLDRDVDGTWLASGQYRPANPIGPASPVYVDEEELWLLESGSFLKRVLSFDAGAFEAEQPSISVAAGGVQGQWLFGGPERAGDVYLILGSLSGTAPGIDLGVGVLPLALDAYFTFCAQGANPAFAAQAGVLDAAGRAASDYTLPAGLPPTLAGVVAAHAFLTLDPITAAVTSTSEAAALELVP